MSRVPLFVAANVVELKRVEEPELESGAMRSLPASVGLALTGLALACAPARVQTDIPHQEGRRFTSGEEIRYLLYLPEGYDESEETWPLLLFLHGAGERGDDLALVAVHGPPKLIEAGQTFPLIVVSPQGPADRWWSSSALYRLLEHLISELREVVPAQLSRGVARQLEECGNDVELTIYPEAGHDAWTQTYENPAVWEWLLRQRRRDR